MSRKAAALASFLLIFAAFLALISLFHSTDSADVPSSFGGTDTVRRGKAGQQNYLVFQCEEESGFLSRIAVISVNNQENSYNLLEFQPNTLCEIPILDENGYVKEYRSDALFRAYEQGNGGKDSCQNLRKAVSKLLFDVEIAGYVRFFGEITEKNAWNRIPDLEGITTDISITTALSLAGKLEQYTFTGTELLPGENEGDFFVLKEKAEEIIMKNFFLTEE